MDYPIYKNNAAASVNEVRPVLSTNNHYVGELFGGGIVVSVWDTDGIQHGLIASLTDLGEVHWTTPAFQEVMIGPLARSLDNGFANTNAIVAQAGTGTTYAAGLCKAYNAGGYTDWYLPAKIELQQCYNSRQTIDTVLGSNGFQNTYYWSSTELGAYFAWSGNFIDGIEDWGPNNKLFTTNSVRAVRVF